MVIILSISVTCPRADNQEYPPTAGEVDRVSFVGNPTPQPRRAAPGDWQQRVTAIELLNVVVGAASGLRGVVVV